MPWEYLGQSIGWYEACLQILDLKDALLDLLTHPYVMNLDMAQGGVESRVFIIDKTNSLLIIILNHQSLSRA